MTVQASATVACSAYPAAPSDASGLVAGTYAYSVTGTTGGAIYGANPYTDDSHISKAAVHAGIVATGKSAIVRLIREDGRFSFPGTTANGVFSERGGSWPRGYTLEKVSDCGGAAPAVPLAPGNPVSSASPSTDGSFTLSWAAPAGSGATPTGYLVYRSGSKSGYLSKPFADRTLSITESDNGSYVYKVYACTGAEANPDCGPAASVTVTVRIPDTDNDGILDNLDTDDDNDGMSDVCENRYGFNPLDAVDGGTTNTDGDGASNVHECLHGTDPTATPANTVLPDTDRDGMYDAWESNNGLDPDDPADALLNDDGDGYTNLEEFTDRTDPQWADSNRDSIPELQFGFNDGYTVEVGTINSGDILQDILVRNPTAGILPSVSDFVLIQKREGGFELEDADDYTITASTLTDIGSKATVVDINGDGAKDLVLTGLDSGTAIITGADDQIVYGNYHERYTIPEKHIALTATRKKFFEDLSGWIDNANYFEVDVAVSTTLDIDEAENSDENQNRSAGFPGYAVFGIVTLADTFFAQNADKCIGLTAELCYVLSPYGFRGKIDAFVKEQLRIRVFGPNQIYFEVKIGATGATQPTTVNVYDISDFDEDARALALYYLQPIRDSGSLVPDATNSKVISEMLEAVLEVPVLNNRLLGVGNGVLPQVEDHASYTGTISDVLQSVDFPRDRITLPAPQTQVTEEERNNSPNLDVLDDLPDCNILGTICNSDSFTREQRNAIRTRIDELADPLMGKIYGSADEAAIALHESGLVDFSVEIGIEIFAIISDLTTRVRIIRVATNFRTDETGDMGDIARGLPTWHTHTSGRDISQPDAAQTAKYNSNTICNSGVDHTAYVSGVRLSKANSKQMVGISDPGNFVFRYSVHSQGLWGNATRPGIGAATLPEFTCNP